MHKRMPVFQTAQKLRFFIEKRKYLFPKKYASMKKKKKEKNIRGKHLIC